MPFIGNKPSAVPLTSADIADGIITSAKIVDATIANADIANSTINLTTKVTGTLPVANGGTGLAALGTANQVLAVNSGATALEYQAVSSDFVKLATTTISSSTATITLDGYMSSTYKHYKFIVSNLEPVGASYYYLYMRYLIANVEATASNYVTSCGGGYIDNGGTPGSYNFGNFNGNKFAIGTNTGQTDNWGFNLEFTILEAQSTNRYKAFVGVNTQRNDDFSSYFTHSIGGIYAGSTSALTGISFSGSANFDKGTITMYGIK